MATRRVLVYDDDSAFIALLQGSLGAYGFDVQAAEPKLDAIPVARAFKPEAIFIAVDAPATIGYTLFNKARVVVGKNTRIVLTTATLPPEDFASHEKLKLHADLYLDKRGLSSDALLRKLDALIGLGPRIAPLLGDDDESFEQIFADDGLDLHEGLDVEVHEVGAGSPKLTISARAPAATPSERFRRKPADTDDVGHDASNKTEPTGAHLVVRDSKGYSDLDRRLTDQQTELFHLRRQLEEARRDARSSPFSSDFLKLRERVVQKDLEITLLTEKLNEINSEVHAGRIGFEELKRTVVGLSAEVSQGLRREEELTALLQEKQHQINSLQEQYSAVVEQAETGTQSAFESAREQAHEQLKKAQEEHTQTLRTLEANHAAQMAHLQSEKDAEIQSLQQKAIEERQQTEDMLALEKEAHQQTQQVAEATIAELREQIDAATQHAETATQSTREEIEEELTKTVENHQRALHTLETNYIAQLAELQAEKDAEIEALNQKFDEERQQTEELFVQERQAHQETRRQIEAKMGELQDRHIAALKQAKLGRDAALESARELAEEEMAKVVEKHQHALHTLETNYIAQLAQLESEKDARIETLEQQVNEEQRAADLLTLEKQAHLQTRRQSEDRIAQLQEEHASALRQLELERDSAFESARELVEEELTRAVENNSQSRHSLQTNFAEQMAQLNDEKDAEIEQLKQKATEEQLVAADRLAREQQAHQQTRQKFETRLAELEDQHAATMKQAELDKDAEVETARMSAKQGWSKTEENYKRAIRTLETKYSAQLKKLESEKDAEIEALEKKALSDQDAAKLLAQEKQAHEKTRQRSEAKLAELRGVLEKAEKEWLDLSKAAEEKHQAELRKAEEKRQADLLDLERAIFTTGGSARSKDK